MRGDLIPISRMLAPVAAALLAAGCSKEAEAPAAHVPPVRTFTLGQAADAAFRRFPGEVAASRNGRLSFDVPGRLIEFPVYDGKIVRQGELIGRLDPADYVAGVDGARARFVAARDEYNRNATLRQRNVIAQNELERHREAFEVAQAALQTAERALEDTQILAPFKGRVAHRFVRNFQSVQARELIVLLQDVSTLEIDIQLPENVMSGVGRNATVDEVRPLIESKAEFAALPGRLFDLELRSFSTRASAASRTFLVSFVFHPPEESNILPGMTSTVLLRFRGQGAGEAAGPAIYNVPVQAVATAEGKSWVWKWDSAKGTVSRVAVELIGPAGEGMQIRSAALGDGDELVASGVRFLSEGMRVRRLETVKP